VSFDWTVALNAIARNLIVPAVCWGAFAVFKLPPAAVREAVITLAVPTAAMAVILAVQFKIAEQEMASSLLFSSTFHSDHGRVYVSNRLTYPFPQDS
jgi:malonate transporter